MSRLILQMQKDFDTAEKIFKDHKIMLSVYKTRINALLRIFKRRLKGWKQEQPDRNTLLFIEEGDPDYIQEQRTKLTDFLFSESEALVNDPEINKIKTDRMMRKIVTTLRKAKEKTKHKAIGAALGGDNVMGFFLKMGISIVYKIEN